MKQISDKKEHQTQARIRGEYENREGPWRGDTTSRAVAPSFFSTRTSPRHDGSSIADYFVDKPDQDQAKYWRNYDIERSLAPELAPRDEYEASLKIQRVAAQTYEGSLIVLGCKLALAVPTVQQAWASSGVRAGDRIVAVNGTAGPAEKLLSLLRRDNKKRRLTLVRPQAEEGLGWRDSVRARRKLFV